MTPIITSLLDTDFYKFTMQQIQYFEFKDVSVRFSLNNRTKSVKLVDEIDEQELIEQLDYTRTLKFSPDEIDYLKSLGIFQDEYLNALSTYQLPPYSISKIDGQYVLESEDVWWKSSPWEIFFMTIVNELRYKTKLRTFKFEEPMAIELKGLIRLRKKLKNIVAHCPDINISDFGTRRRFSKSYQEAVIRNAKQELGTCLTGTSNVMFAKKLGLTPKGSNAHEFPMVMMALGKKNGVLDTKIQYQVLELFEKYYGKGVFLPDTFGTTQFLENAPDWVSEWTGARPDSKDPYEAADELINWWMTNDQNPKEKMVLFSDGLDVTIDEFSNGDDIVALYKKYDGTIIPAFGWGTNLTNDLTQAGKEYGVDLKPISIVAKAMSANGIPTVKLSDNPNKATSVSKEEIILYKDTFGDIGLHNKETLV